MGRDPMSLQISRLVLYSRKGDLREVAFRSGNLSIITGASKTGKSAIIDIVDYCSGRSECNVADGVIREHVAWYGIVFRLGDGEIFVARRNPALGEKTSGDVYLERASQVILPTFEALKKNTTVDALEKFLGAAIGISENENRPVGFTRPPLEANFRHSLLFCIQDQNDIDSKQRLFHRQGEDFIGTAIKDTLPYFLGAFDEDHLLKQAHLDQARKEMRQLERQLRDSEAVDTNTFPRARALMDEAKAVGLIDDRTTTTSYEATLETLNRIARESRVRDEMVIADEAELLSRLRSERQGLRSELERVNAEIRSTRNFTTETGGYEHEVKEQRARLSSVGLVKPNDHAAGQCPVCNSILETPVPTVVQIDSSLQLLRQQLEAVEAENPRLLARLAGLEREAAVIQDRLRENQQQIATRIHENEFLQGQQETFVLQARAIGKITQYVETVTSVEASSTLRSMLDTARNRVALLEQELDPDAARERLDTFLNIIGRYMTEYSDHLDLEHRGSQLRLDPRGLTVIADTLNGPVPLFRMGSGENWVGYHVLAHLALHKWFRQKGRPVPAFLFLDQPSQAHYPPEKDAEGSIDALGNEDQAAVLQLFQLASDAATELAPELQVIIMDHADLKTDWFREAVVERWRNGLKLIPQEWLD
jgi:hypothetical protein